jgi:ankyrin repeat protein
MMGTFANLRNAILVGNVQIVKDSLDSGANVNGRDQDGWTPLMFAAFHGRAEIVKVLLDRGADIRIKDNNGTTALMAAVNSRHLDIIEILLDRGADVNTKAKKAWTPLMLASLQGYTDVVKVLLARRADVNLKDTFDGSTALMFAVQEGHPEIVKMLLDRGADVNVKNKDGVTALRIAAQEGHDEIIKLLLKKARPNSFTKDLQSAAESIDRTMDRGRHREEVAQEATYQRETSPQAAVGMDAEQGAKSSGPELRSCEGCARQIKSTDMTCAHCGYTQWGSIIGIGIFALVLLGAAILWRPQIESSSWQLIVTIVRWVVGIIGAICAFGTIAEVVTALKTPKTYTK